MVSGFFLNLLQKVRKITGRVKERRQKGRLSKLYQGSALAAEASAQGFLHPGWLPRWLAGIQQPDFFHLHLWRQHHHHQFIHHIFTAWAKRCCQQPGIPTFRGLRHRSYHHRILQQCGLILILCQLRCGSLGASIRNLTPLQPFMKAFTCRNSKEQQNLTRPESIHLIA